MEGWLARVTFFSADKTVFSTDYTVNPEGGISAQKSTYKRVYI